MMTDIFHKKDMPKLIYCLHALRYSIKGGEEREREREREVM